MSGRAWRLAALLGALVVASGCDALPCVGDDCGSRAESAFSTRAALDAPASVTPAEPFEAVVTATPRLSGVGSVRIVAQVGRLRALAPVADTLGANVGTRATTRPVRVVLNAGQPVRVAWTLAVDQTAPVLNPGLGAVVAFDSVRTPEGALVGADEYSTRYGPSPSGVAVSTTAEVRPIRVAGR